MQLTDSSPGENRIRIVETLWNCPGLSRNDLTALLDLDKSTLSRLTARLLETGMIREVSRSGSGPRGGRPPVGLAVRGDWGLWSGIELHPDGYRGVLADFAGSVRARFTRERPVTPATLNGILTEAAREAGELSRTCGVPLIGAGLSVPGPVRPGTSIVERSRPLGITAPVDLGALNMSLTGLPTRVDKDVNCGCIGEFRFAGPSRTDAVDLLKPADGPGAGGPGTDDAPKAGVRRGSERGRRGERRVGGDGSSSGELSPADVRNSLYLLAESRRGGLALGLGLMVDGRPVRGDHGAGGEIFSVYRHDGFEQLALDRDTLVHAVDDPAVMDRVVAELAPQVAFLANALDIDLLILGGLFQRDFNRIGPVFRAEMLRRRTYPDLAVPGIVCARRGEDAVAYGAAVMFTEDTRSQHFWRIS